MSESIEEDEIFGEILELDDPEFEGIFEEETTSLIDLRERTGDERISKPFLGKLAKARLIAARSAQLRLGAPSTIPRERLRSGKLHEIAKQELEERVIPLKIIRKFADKTYEVWSITDFKYITRN